MLSAAVLVLTLAPVADPADDLARVLAGWERRRNVVTTARYVVRQVVAAAPGVTPAGVVASRSIVLFDFVNHRTRCDQDTTLLAGPSNAQTPRRLRASTRLDGAEWTHAVRLDPHPGITRDDDPMATVSIDRTSSRPVLPSNLDPLLWAHGRFTDPAADRFLVAGSVAVAGRSCLQLRSPSARPEIWTVDPAHDGAVVRRAVELPSAPKKTAARLVLEAEYQDTPHGRMPAGWAVTRTPEGGPPVEEERFTVESAEYNVPLPGAEFRFTPMPGMTVHVDGEAFQVAADGTWRPDPVNRPGWKEQFWGSGVGRTVRTAIDLGWTPAGGLAAVAGLTGWCLWRRTRRVARE